MSIPTAVFLDTSVFDGQQYNFQSAALSSFVPACSKRAVKLLLPDPTEREIRRHIRERSVQALKALEDARRKAPFLAKWRGLPQRVGPNAMADWEVHHIAHSEWTSFLRQFTVVRLGYDMLDLRKVMKWYDDIEAPFAEGKKRKEFPDAFALAMLDAYAKKEGLYVAVASTDTDIQLACKRFGTLLYFASVPRLTQLLLSEDHRVDALRASVDSKIDMLWEVLSDELTGLNYFHTNDRFEVRDVSYELADIDTSIVAIGDGECTVAFDASLNATATLRWEEIGEDAPEWREVDAPDEVSVSGVAKMSFNESADVTEVLLVRLDQTEVSFSARPYGRWY